MAQTVSTNHAPPTRGLAFWVSAVLPLVALGLLLSIFAVSDPLALFKQPLPPVEELTFESVRVTPDGFRAVLVNGGPDPVTVAQVLVDEAYWEFSISPSATIPPLGRAELTVPYPWVATEPHEILVLTETGLTFAGEVEVAVPSPTPGLREFLGFGLLGVYVGVIPVVLGMLWYPAMRRMGRRWLGAVLALTVGLLVFLLLDTLLEALEVAATLPEVFGGVALVFFAALLTWLLLMAVGARRGPSLQQDPWRRALYLATLIALGIGLHNLGEGLAIGAAFALGEAALGSFLVIGFTVHNVTEGVGIVAPIVSAAGQAEREGTMRRPRLILLAGLALLAGLPAVLGAWVGGFAYSPYLATLFLGVGVGAIWQVVVDVTALLRDYARRLNEPLASWPNLIGFALGLGVMYLTALLVLA